MPDDMVPIVPFVAHVTERAEALPQGRIVYSNVGRGESPIGAAVPSLKFVLEGEEVHEIDGRPHRVHAGQMLFVDRGAPYRALIRNSEGARGLCVYLPGTPQTGAEDPLMGRALIQPVDTPLGRVLHDTAFQLHRAGRDGIDGAFLLGTIRAGLEETLISAGQRLHLLDVRKATTRREILNRLECARAYLHAHPDRNVPLGELATAVGLSSFHLARYFSAAFGVPPVRYHRRLRLDHAAEALRRGEASVTEIAQRAGYAELSAFTHAFRREFGTPPSGLRALEV
jgi:AraC-like DNA-binding protein